MKGSVSGSRVSLTWGPPATGKPTSYIIEAGSSTGLVNIVNSDTRNLQTSLTVDGVGEDIYYVRVRATDGNVISEPSDEVTLVVGRGCSFAPQAPTGLVATVIGLVKFGAGQQRRKSARGPLGRLTGWAPARFFANLF